MKRSIHTLEQLQLRLRSDAATTGGGSGRTGTTVEQRRTAEAAKQKRLATLTPYKQAEYRCVECVAELRQALRDVEEFEAALGRRTSAGVGRSREAEETGDAVDADDDESMRLLRRQEGRQGSSSSTETALLEQELARSRQQARRAHQRLQQLQREAARLASRAAAKAPAVTSSAAVASVGDASAPSAALEALEWQRALPHVERAKGWYRGVFGIRVVSSLDDPVLQLNRPAQPQQSAGSMAHFGRGANAVPSCVTAAAEGSSSPSAQARGSEARADGAATASPLLMLESAREDAEFREFFASVQANDELIDAAMDRISDGVHRLLENARGIQDELVVQEALLQQTEASAEAAEAQLTQMSRRLSRAIRELEDSSICMYVVCLLVLLLVLGLLLRVAS
ncbi:putative Qb-SNARE protein [Leishmania major strain Friedlin]|uniref:Putative Qb-SNARE protein n=1 Tax=Leishmania major TaxID=5664 RepID=Q4QIZ5_LEIMA|nr:putative Qb-SNARE protein [Leishmania major strain Friedlin]CAG9568879.1 Qb-SNARE_protein_-_putative [Leishmania major strain Friedlin]CAJ02128.1 putative Qb-SNARE protein [Leishmania major strain Friedlin]|eukprot:XP_001680853.1 putative Qb-SNARE protein [Leishmania major strain Friedlin]